MIIKNDNIPFLEGYFISKKGRLWSRYDKSGHITKDSWHRVKYNTSKQGYKFIQRRGKIHYIHRLVARVYQGLPYERSSTSVYIKSVLLYKIKFLYLYNENKY